MNVQDSGFRSRVPVLAMFVLAGAIFCTGITWGLPSSAVNAYLFGAEPVWSGEKIQQLAGGWSDSPARGADVDLNPLARDGRPVVLNATDAQRAEIVRRYRLYTYQPDEMITMRALSGIRPGEGRFDPRLYQYGGLWIYPVGALLKVATLTGYVTLKSDVAWYLDHPEEFGRFYVVARLYAAAWGMVGLWAVYCLARRLTGGALLSSLFAGLVYVCMPVVINMAHEAKPHLPGAVLQLLAILAAMRFVETGLRKWWLVTAILCGAAFGMVLSAWPVFVVLPVMLALRPRRWPQAAALVGSGGLIGAATYLLTNPYIVINLFVNREVLRSNFGNSLAMYALGRWPEGLMNATRLAAEGASLTAALIGVLAVVFGGAGYVLAARRAAHQPRESSVPSPAGVEAAAKYWLLLAAPVAVILLQFTALAAGKPGEYGRFAILPDVALGLAAIAGIQQVLPSRGPRAFVLSVFLILVAIPGYAYLSGFIADTDARTASRRQSADFIALMNSGGGTVLAVTAEPAPYGLPPVNLFTWQIVLARGDTPLDQVTPPADLAVWPQGEPGPLAPSPRNFAMSRPTPHWKHDISWADKHFNSWIRLSLFPMPTSMSQPSTRSF